MIREVLALEKGRRRRLNALSILSTKKRHSRKRPIREVVSIYIVGIFVSELVRTFQQFFEVAALDDANGKCRLLAWLHV